MNGLRKKGLSKFYDELMESMQEALAISKGKLKGRRTQVEIQPVPKYTNEQIRAIRNSVGMTQSVFATYMGVSTKTVEAWEKGTNHPTGSACRLLSLLEDKDFPNPPFVKFIRIE